MKAVIDISLLGQGYYYPKSRTGIFRVVEKMAQLMPEISPDLEVLFAENLNLLASIGYSEHNFSSGNFRYINDVSELESKTKQSVLLTKFNHNSFVHKALKNFFLKINKNNLSLREELLKVTNIYHSPYHPIPEQIHGFKNIQKVITIHDLIPIKFPQFFQNNNNSDVHKIIASLQDNTHVICISESTKNDFLEITNHPSEQVSVIPLAASKELFYPVHDTILRNRVLSKYQINSPYLLSVATIEPRKNLSKLIQCFSKIIRQDKASDLTLVLVGTKGWDFDQILKDVKNSPNLSKRIIFTGYVPDYDLATLYSSARCFVFLSIYEGFGLPPLEAMQCGTPVVCSNTSSMPEVLANGGVLVSPDNEDEICHKILEVVGNEQLRNQLSIKAIERASQFSWEKFSEQTYKTYKKIV